MKPASPSRSRCETGGHGRRPRGYALAEILVVIVVIALVLGPLLASTSVVATMQHRTGERSRRESWRSMQDAALVAGVDPNKASGFAAGHEAIPSAVAAKVERCDALSPAGTPRLRALKAVAGGEAGRVGGSGWEIAAGVALPSASATAMPELPVVLAPPTVAPSDGARVPVLSLAPGMAGGAATLAVIGNSPEGLRVRMTGGAGIASGGGRAMLAATALELAAGYRGTAWTEYPGTGAAGETQETLPDGRIRWTVTNSEGRTRVYEPSDVVAFEIGLDLGSPILAWGGAELASGLSISVDHAAYLDVRKGVASVRVTWPQAVVDLLGSDAPAVLPAPSCFFAGVAATGGGDLAEFFRPERSELWSNETKVTAEALVSGARRASGGEWVLQRAVVALDPPELTANPFLRSSAYEAGAFEFAVPARPSGERLGRVSAQAGALMSTGPTLSLSFSP